MAAYRALPNPVPGRTRLRAKSEDGADSFPQCCFLLPPVQDLEPPASGVQEDERRVGDVMPGGELSSLGGVQVRQDKGDLAAKLRPERVDHALELRAVRSPRQEHLDNRRLLTDNIEVTVPRLTRQGDRQDDGGHRERRRKKEDRAPPFLCLTSCHCFLSSELTPLAHRLFPHRYVICPTENAIRGGRPRLPVITTVEQAPIYDL